MVAITAAPSLIDQEQIQCPSPRDNAGAAAIIPCVDLSAPGAAAAVADACRRVGFFRATNHGVPARVAEALDAHAMAFFALPTQEKVDMAGDALGRPMAMGYGSKSIGVNGDVGWLEYLLILTVSGNTASLPPSLRTALEEYTAAVRALGGRVLELIAEGLGVDRSLLRAMVVGREGSDELVLVNHYPPVDCGGVSVTGFGEHTDPQIISVLWSNRTPGLQIMFRDGRWVPVPPAPESFFVNVGDALQVLTNGRFKSVNHRVVVVPEGPESRLSVIYFGEPAPSQRIAPLPQVMQDGEQSLYREFTWADYKSHTCKTRLADHRLGPFELQHATDGNRPGDGEPIRRTATAACSSSMPQLQVARRRRCTRPHTVPGLESSAKPALVYGHG